MKNHVPGYLWRQYDILACGPYMPGQIEIEYTPSKKSFSYKMLESIDGEWKRQKTKYPETFDGPLYNLDEFHTGNQTLNLKLSDTSYREYVGTRNEAYTKMFGASSAVNPLSVGMIVTTMDEQCIIGVRGGAVDSYHGKYATIAGYMERGTDMRNNIPTPYITVVRELYEESGVSEQDIDRVLLLGITGRKQTLIAFHVSLKIDSEQFNQLLPEEEEFSEFHYLRNEAGELSEFLVREKPRIPTYCGANLVLYGLDRFGLKWAESLVDMLK